MRIFFRNRKGQSGLEYGILFVMAVLALVALQHFFRRAYAGRLKSSSEDVGQPFDEVKSSGQTRTVISGDQNATQQTTTYSEHLDGMLAR